MRLVVISDSHGCSLDVRRIIDSEPRADYVVFLGDGCSDLDGVRVQYRDKYTFILVGGNCDYGSYPVSEVFTVASKRILAVHGHTLNVKFGFTELGYAAAENKADIVLFGHTHTKLCLYEDGVYYFNPGSARSLDYGIVDITDAGVVCFHKSLPF